MKICVLGLGNMGLPVAVNLARAGHDVTGANIVDVPAATEAGVAVSTDATVALRDREVVFCLLPDLPYLEPMLPALIEGGTKDLVVMSTISPSAVRGLAERLDGQVNVMDACMSGGVAKAKLSRAVLIQALRFYARQGGSSLQGFIGLLGELRLAAPGVGGARGREPVP
mgnify:CR=1 FL=1